MKVKRFGNRFVNRMFVQRIVPNVPVKIDEFGHSIIPVEWIETDEINLGSVAKPNKQIISIKIEPHLIEEDQDA